VGGGEALICKGGPNIQGIVKKNLFKIVVQV
jgi:hypothetical protein